MKKILIAVVLALGVSSAFGQVKQVVSLNGNKVSFDFRDNFSKVKVIGVGTESMCKSTVMQEEGCFYFLIEDSEISLIYTVCTDNSAALTDGDVVLDGYVISSNKNNK
jgi:hypothetical protein